MPADQVVPGDVVLLESGARRARRTCGWSSAAELASQEAALTGESHAVDKRVEPLDDPRLPLGDRLYLVYKGTIIARGRGVGVCAATGMRYGARAHRTPAVRGRGEPHAAAAGWQGLRAAAVACVLAICVVVFVAGLLRGEDVLLMLLTSISLAVAAIPEALPAVVTISLALGARKMVARMH